MLAKLLEDIYPQDLISPFQLIIVLLVLLIATLVINMFDVGIFTSLIFFDLIHYRLRYWFNKFILFRKQPFVISRPELFLAGGSGRAGETESGTTDDETKRRQKEQQEEWKKTLAEIANRDTLLSSSGTMTFHHAKVTTSDLDMMLHCNNARYLREADLARFAWLHQSGVFHACWFNGLSPVTASQTIRYRRELPFQCRYTIVTRCVGWDGKAIFLEQLFVVKGDIHAVLEVREGISVPRRLKEKFPETATAPLTWVMRNKLKWEKSVVPDVKVLPKDVENWNQFLVDNSTRVVIAGGGGTQQN